MIFFYRLLLVPLITIILFPTFLYASTTITKNISTLCQGKPIILLGETHRKPTSQKLFIKLVQHYVQQGNRVFIGLEIPADQQKKLDVALLGSDIDFSFLYQTIDHSAYRDMVRTFGAMKGNVIVRAIDANSDEDNRDLAMSRNLMTVLLAGKYDKILVLVGNNHVIKNIKWHEELADQKKQYLAGYLIAGGVDPCSVQQLFRDGSGGGDAVLVNTDTERGSALAMEVIKSVNHSMTMTGRGVSDGVVEWR